MLTTPDNLLFLHLLDDGLQDKLLHHLSRDGGEADQPVVPWVLLLSLFADWSFLHVSLIIVYLFRDIIVFPLSLCTLLSLF